MTDPRIDEDGGLIESVARVCHEANRAYRETIGEDAELPWDDAPEWLKESLVEGVAKIFTGEINLPSQSHESWLAHKQADGWKFGPEKDPAKKEHPCMVPFDDLPEEQQMKDHLFFAVARTLLFSQP